jgi:hypothetical protein
MEEEIQVNFRLDTDGRICLAADEDDKCSLDYNTRVAATHLVVSSTDQTIDESLFDEVLFDCEISDSGLLPRTFWIGAKDQPRCNLERIAKDIFDYHVSSSSCAVNFHTETSGAEWWVQIRPSPQTGRYSMQGMDDETGISFHFDKDEDLRILCGGKTYVHPHLSTVTYLTDYGAPTLIVEGFRVNNLTGDYMIAETKDLGIFVSWPLTGKHLSFDGRFLHAAPSDLQEPGSFSQQCEFSNGENMDPKIVRKKERQHRRCTFLVNIWLNYKPFNVNPFPETLLDKMSGFREESNGHKVKLLFNKNEDNSDPFRIRGTNVAAITASFNQTMVEAAGVLPGMERFTWPIGDCDSDEAIQVNLPLKAIREEAIEGGNVCIRYSQNDDKPDDIIFVVKNYAQESSKKRRRDDDDDDVDDGIANSKES